MQKSLPPTFAEKDLNYYLRMIRGDFSELEETQTVKVGGPSSQKNVVILLTSCTVGTGNEELGKRLLRHFLQSLINQKIKPKALILMNSAVNLACEGSEVLAKLTVLEEQGIRIMVCAVSADELVPGDDLRVGFLADMDAICDNLLSAWKVITL
jgi:hypothetical protein